MISFNKTQRQNIQIGAKTWYPQIVNNSSLPYFFRRFIQDCNNNHLESQKKSVPLSLDKRYTPQLKIKKYS